MDERHTAAAAAIIAGQSIEEAAKAAHRVPKTIYQWAEEPEFQAVVLRGIHAKALIDLALYANGKLDNKAGQAALSIVKWMGAPAKRRGNKGVVNTKGDVVPMDEDETDLGDLSQEQLDRFGGEE